jgi:hypothetical protein
MLTRFEKRLRDLEGVNPANGIVLHFENGSTRSFQIHKKGVLGLFCASMHLFHWACYPEEYTPEKRKEKAERKDVVRDPEYREDPATGRPITKFDPLLELLGRAMHISGPGAKHLINEVWAQQRKRMETLRRGEKFYFSQENRDPFFDGCKVGPLTGQEPKQLKAGNADPKSADLNSPEGRNEAI